MADPRHTIAPSASDQSHLTDPDVQYKNEDSIDLLKMLYASQRKQLKKSPQYHNNQRRNSEVKAISSSITIHLLLLPGCRV